jgi:hypothetical protein
MLIDFIDVELIVSIIYQMFFLNQTIREILLKFL